MSPVSGFATKSGARRGYRARAGIPRAGSARLLRRRRPDRFPMRLHRRRWRGAAGREPSSRTPVAFQGWRVHDHAHPGARSRRQSCSSRRRARPLRRCRPRNRHSAHAGPRQPRRRRGGGPSDARTTGGPSDLRSAWTPRAARRPSTRGHAGRCRRRARRPAVAGRAHQAHVAGGEGRHDVSESQPAPEGERVSSHWKKRSAHTSGARAFPHCTARSAWGVPMADLPPVDLVGWLANCRVRRAGSGAGWLSRFS